MKFLVLWNRVKGLDVAHVLEIRLASRDIALRRYLDDNLLIADEIRVIPTEQYNVDWMWWLAEHGVILSR